MVETPTQEHQHFGAKLTIPMAHDTKISAMPSGTQTVLIVDDDPIVLAVAEERLAGLGYDVTTRDQVLGTSQWIVQNRPWVLLLPSLDDREPKFYALPQPAPPPKDGDNRGPQRYQAPGTDA
jgi:hypothetical protein